ncbi:MAG: tRNA1Val (adenine37-N6)-methyltransferase [Hyphomicrobiaceae bacterium]
MTVTVTTSQIPDSDASPGPPWPKDATRDRLVGDWHIYQRRGGHRTSTDDLLTAWFCTQRCVRPVQTYLDLGCGTASVLLMTAYVLRPASSVGVEAQAQSAQLATRSVAELPKGAPTIEIVNNDFRAVDWDERRFDVITGSPPYFPIGSGQLPDDAQRRACRFEERGGIEEYCQTAAAALKPEGDFYVVFQSTWDDRVLRAAELAGLQLRARADVEARQGRGPFLTVYEFTRSAKQVRKISFAVRDDAGNWTAAFEELRRSMGYS